MFSLTRKKKHVSLKHVKLKAVENLFFWGKQFRLDLQGEKCNTLAPCCVLASHIYQKSPVQL